MGAETCVHSELEFGGFGKEILGCGIRGETVETFPKDLFETVKARIVSGDERQVMVSWGGGGAGGGHGIAVFG